MNICRKVKKLVVLTVWSVTVSLVISMVTPMIPKVFVYASAAEKSEAKISEEELTLVIGETEKLKVTGTSEKVKWSSSDREIATVNSKGKVTAKKFGTVMITAKFGTEKLTCKVKVKPFYGKHEQFESGTMIDVPQHWWVSNSQHEGGERFEFGASGSHDTRLIVSEEKADGRDKDDFITDYKKSMTEEKLEETFEEEFDMDLTQEDFSQTFSMDEDCARGMTYIDYSSHSKPALQVTIYCIYTGSYVYELRSYNCYDTDMNLYSYITYIYQNISY